MDQQVLEQLHAIYSKENLEKDNFFREMTQQHPEGWITLKKLSSIKRFKTLINGDISILVAAAKLAPEKFEIDTDQTKLRAIASTENGDAKVEDEKLDKIKDYWSYQNQRSIYAKGFPCDPEPEKSQLMELFKEFGRVIHIKYRREEDKTFKGSIFVEFETNEMASSCLEKEHQYGGNDLLLMKKQDYVDMKAREKYAGATSFVTEGKTMRHYVEFSGAEGLGVTGVKEVLDGHNVKVGKFEFMKDPDGVGILQLSDEMTAEGFFATLDENNKLGPLSFRLASDEQRIEYRRISKERHEKFKQRGNNRGRGGRGRGNAGFKRRHNDNGREDNKTGEKRRREDQK